MVLAAAMPVGANVFMFSQRYKVAQEEITMGVMLTTLSALITLPLIMGLLTWVQSLP
jgi:predicted permease